MFGEGHARSPSSSNIEVYFPLLLLFDLPLTVSLNTEESGR